MINFLDKNVGEWLQVPRLYFCISPHKIAPLSTPEAPCLPCTEALVHCWDVGAREARAEVQEGNISGRGRLFAQYTTSLRKGAVLLHQQTLTVYEKHTNTSYCFLFMFLFLGWARAPQTTLKLSTIPCYLSLLPHVLWWLLFLPSLLQQGNQGIWKCPPSSWALTET